MSDRYNIDEKSFCIYVNLNRTILNLNLLNVTIYSNECIHFLTRLFFSFLGKLLKNHTKKKNFIDNSFRTTIV